MLSFCDYFSSPYFLMKKFDIYPLGTISEQREERSWETYRGAQKRQGRCAFISRFVIRDWFRFRRVIHLLIYPTLREFETGKWSSSRKSDETTLNPKHGYPSVANGNHHGFVTHSSILVPGRTRRCNVEKYPMWIPNVLGTGLSCLKFTSIHEWTDG